MLSHLLCFVLEIYSLTSTCWQHVFLLKVTRIEDSIEDFQQLLKQFGLDSKDHSSPGTGRVVFWAEWACLVKGLTDVISGFLIDLIYQFNEFHISESELGIIRPQGRNVCLRTLLLAKPQDMMAKCSPQCSAVGLPLEVRRSNWA